MSRASKLGCFRTTVSASCENRSRQNKQHSDSPKDMALNAALGLVSDVRSEYGREVTWQNYRADHLTRCFSQGAKCFIPNGAITTKPLFVK